MSSGRNVLFGAGVAALLLAWLFAAKGDAVVSTVRGLRNRNPGNLRANEFDGFAGLDDDGYAIFTTLAKGTRGAARQLKLYFARGITTVRAIVSTWAPNTENNTQAYIDAVCRSIGRTRDSSLVLDETTHLALLRAIFRHELGALAASTISDADIIVAIRAA